MGQKCGVDFEGQPDLVLAAEHALKPALWEWTEGRLNAFADCDDILSISRAINLGNPRAPRRPNGMEDRVAWYARVRPLIERVEFAAAAGELAPQTVPDATAAAGGRTSRTEHRCDRRRSAFLRFGDRGSDVQAVQRALARLGYGLSGTGNYGANTQAAVADFQARHGLEVDAEVGAADRHGDRRCACVRDAGRQASGRGATTAGRARSRRGQSRQPRLRRPAPRPHSQTLAARLGDRILRTGDAGDLVRAIQICAREGSATT